ncbi:MAG: RNA methyltransferase [Alphaproteobacteria bacterium]|nr:RNA methyltransferase [Alphaproteobacteria bacterium]
MRGYFGIGVEGISKPGNLGALFRSAHAFGASFVFTIGASYRRNAADTTNAPANLPFYEFVDLDALRLPAGCALVGIEFRDDATELPSFRHPRTAAYVLGPERGSLSARLVECCDHVVKIPTRLCVNLSVAGAIVMYDRLLSVGRFAERPVTPGGPTAPLPPPVFGDVVVRRGGRKVPLSKAKPG